MVKSLLHKLKGGPTILTLSDILFVMKNLQRIDEKEIIINSDCFLEILDILIESYCDSGIFEVDDNNKFLLNDFNCWLLKLDTKYFIGKKNDTLLAYRNTFLITM